MTETQARVPRKGVYLRFGIAKPIGDGPHSCPEPSLKATPLWGDDAYFPDARAAKREMNTRIPIDDANSSSESLTLCRAAQHVVGPERG